VFYRRKIKATLLQLFDGQLEKIRLQKLLFLFTTKQINAEYDSIPYKFGCFSCEKFIKMMVILQLMTNLLLFV